MPYTHNSLLQNDPYNDDFDDYKNFLRILFKPGYAVQARELTQLQTILQNQISKFGDHIFKDGSLVTGGLTSLSKVSFVRLYGNYQIDNLNNLVGHFLIGDVNPNNRAKVIAVLPATVYDNYAIVFLQYWSDTTLSYSENLYVDTFLQTLKDFLGSTSATIRIKPLNTDNDSIGNATAVTIDDGLFYVDGFFVNTVSQILPLYTTTFDGKRIFNSPTNIFGFTINKSAITTKTDTSLTDPANGSYNFAAPGADRYRIDLILNSLPYDGNTSIDNSSQISAENFIEIGRILDGKLIFVKNTPNYSDIIDLLAKRTFDESGSYTTKPFEIEIKNHIRRDMVSANITLLSENAYTETPTPSITRIPFTYPAASDTPYIIDNQVSDNLPPTVGDILIESSTGIEYKIIKVSDILKNSFESNTTIVGTVNVVLQPLDSYVYKFKNRTGAENNPYTLLKANENKFALKRLGNTNTQQSSCYYVTNSVPFIIADNTGTNSILDTVTGDPDKFSIVVKPGKAYIYGYEFETSSPVYVSSDKPRDYLVVENNIIDTTIGNYLKINSTVLGDDPSFFYFSPKDVNDSSTGKHDTSIQFDKLPDVTLKSNISSILFPRGDDIFTVLKVLYWSPSIKNIQKPNDFTSLVSQPMVIGIANYRDMYDTGAISYTKTNLYQSVLFIAHKTDVGRPVLFGEAGSDSENSFIDSRTTKDKGILKLGKNTPSIKILDNSYRTEFNISRLVFSELYHGDFTTAYDTLIKSTNINNILDSAHRTYEDNESNYVYQVDYLNIGSFPQSPTTLTDIQSHIRVKQANTRRWIPGGSYQGLTSPSTLYVEIPEYNVMFGPSADMNQTYQSFSLPGDNTSYESGCIFNPTSEFNMSYGTSIVHSIDENDVWEIKLTTSPTSGGASCVEDIGAQTVRGIGAYVVGRQVRQVYYFNNELVEATGIIMKVLNSTGSHTVFVKKQGNGDFIPQSLDGTTLYDGISALVMQDTPQGQICACYSIASASLREEASPTCGQYTSIKFSEQSNSGDFVEGKTVYQYNLDVVPTTNDSNQNLQNLIAVGIVVNWDKTTSELTILTTKNQFNAKYGWIFQQGTTVRYGGRGWVNNLHLTENISSKIGIKKSYGIFVDLEQVDNYQEFSDSLDTSASIDEKIATQLRVNMDSILTPNALTGLPSTLLPDGFIDSSMIGNKVYQEIEGIISEGEVVYFDRGTPENGYSILTIKEIPGKTFEFQIGVPYDITYNVPNTDPTAAVEVIHFNTINSQVANPLSTMNTTVNFDPNAPIVSMVLPKSTIAKAKLKQIKYYPNDGDKNSNEYYLYLSDIVPFIVPGSNNIYEITNINSVFVTPKGGGPLNEIQLFKVATDSPNLSSPTNNTLLYKPELGVRIKEITNLTYELQTDLLGSYIAGSSTISFKLGIAANCKFKGSHNSKITTDILSTDYILISNTSRVINLADNKYVSSTNISVDNITLTVNLTPEGISKMEAGTYRLLCPVAVTGSLSSNIRTKTKKKRIEVTSFNDATGIISLRSSDVISIDSCVDLDTNTQIPLEILQLNTNQTQNMYKLSTVTAKETWRDYNFPDSTRTFVKAVPNGTPCLISYTYFDHGTESGPIIPASYIDGYDQNPIHLDPSTNQKIQLDSVIDFRPYQYISDIGNIETAGITGIPITGSTMNISYSYYLPRKYKLVLSRDKTMSLIGGVSSLDPTFPSDQLYSMTLFKIEVPAYFGETDTAKLVNINHQRYTMDDIRVLEERIENIEYITKLNYLEQSAQRTVILNDMEKERPKTSILVDSFINHEIGDTLNPDYNICIDSDKNILRPTFDCKFINMELNQQKSTGLYRVIREYQPAGNSQFTIAPNLVTLNFSSIPEIQQLQYTDIMKISPFSIDMWIGDISLSSNGDFVYDASVTPDVVSNYNGENDTFQNMKYSALNNNLGAFGTKWNFWKKNWQGYSEDSKGETQFLGHLDERIKVQTPKISKKKIGENTIDIDIVPYVSSKTINMFVRKMKPNTRIYPYFDGVRVDSYCSNIINPASRIFTTDSVGSINLQFTIPQGEFKTGQKNIIVMDNENYEPSLATTYAQADYTTNGFITELNDHLSSYQTKNVSFNGSGQQTILAQTFSVDVNKYPNGMFISKIDMYFASKDQILPITLEIRPVSSGVPVIGENAYAYPSSTVSKSPSQITTVSAPTSANGTSFEFDAPVHLLPGEHSIVLYTNSDMYSVWTAESGKIIQNSSNRASTQPYAGKLFKTNKNSNWISYENIDLSFQMHRCQFETSAELIFNEESILNFSGYEYSLANINLSHFDFSSNMTEIGIKVIDQIGDDIYSEAIPQQTINPNTNIYFDSKKQLLYNGSSVLLSVKLHSDGVIAPLIDLDRLKLITVSNIISTMKEQTFTSSGGMVTRERNELYPFSTSHTDFINARYITKTVELDPQMQTKDCYVYLKINRPEGTGLNVYIKRQFIDTDTGAKDLPYELLESVVIDTPTSDPNKFTDITFKIPETAVNNTFMRYSIKLVLYANEKNSHVVPKLKDLRIITVA